MGTPDGSTGGPDGGDAGPTFVDSGSRDAGAPGDGGPGCLTEEICGNGLDDNCDGVVEEGCPCLPGEMAACFRGPATARGVGACTDGTMVCMDGLEFGEWGPCEGDVLPEAEVCDAEGRDESCDGAANEGCDCDPSQPTVACGSDTGECSPGTQECVAGMLGPCMGAVGPVGEVCNNLDDDCDGTIDEGITRACGTNMGECSVGTETCVAGRFEACVGGTLAVDELCDSLDNDCDGSVDESLSRACGSSVGACMPGTQTCSGGAWGMCAGETMPTLESCDNTDEDCDGRIDEGVTRACGSSTGICTPGTETCTAGAWGACTGGTGPGMEVCDGMNDENCDGTVDEGCTCTIGAMRSCGSNTGLCMAGTQTCNSPGTWGMCMGEIGPVPEACNMLDDDCDGAVDEGGICPTAPPIVTCPADITANVLDTVSLAGSGSDPDGGTVTYQWTVTSRPPGSTSTPDSPTSASTNFFLDASGTYTVELCVTDDEMERACCTVTITSNPPGNLHVEVSWDTVYGDLDAHLLSTAVTAPNGWFTADDCYWANRTPDWGPAGVDGNPTLDRDDTDGYGPENITIDTNPVAGTYSVGLHYYCSHSIGAGSAPGDGPTTATVRVYCMGSLIATYTGLNMTATDDWLNVAEVTYPGCVGTSINTRTNGSSILPSSFTTARHCEISCSTDSDCPAGERCARVGGGGPPRNACILR